MPLISKQEEQLLDPLSAQVSAKLNGFAGGVSICRFKLKEFVYFRAKQRILHKHPDWDDEEVMTKEALARLVDIDARLDYQEDLQRLVEEFCALAKEEAQDPEVPARVQKHEASNRLIFEKEFVETHPDKAVDKPVASGRRTLLHLACEQGNYDEVVRLVEQEKAKVTIKDASNWTPKERARFFNTTENHAKIISYLDHLS